MPEQHYSTLEALSSHDKNNSYENILDDPNSKLGKIINYFLAFLVISFCLVISVESMLESGLYMKELFYFDAFISTVFAIEYFYRFFKSRNKLKFFIEPMRVIDLLSFLPFFLGYFVGSQYLTFLRIIKFLRVLKLLKNIPLTSKFIESLKFYLDEFKAVLIIYGIILFVVASLVYYAEKDVVGTTFTSIPASLWWGLVTMASLGYGDMVPQTNLGKILGSILVFVGPIIGSIIGAITILIFMDNSKIDTKTITPGTKVCKICMTKNPPRANYCIKCGADIHSKF